MIRNNLMRAITYAANKHRDQVRKVDKTPFIAHPYRVAMLLQEHDCDAEIVIAALLHDTVEDTDCTFEEIEHLFGGGVKTYVDYVTELDKHVPWKERKEHSIEAFKSVPYDVKLLIAADKIDNLQSMIDQEMVHGEAMWHNFVGSREEQVWYYSEIFSSITENLADDEWHPLFYLFQALLEKFAEGDLTHE
ncbi:phosphohydrolase [Halolactibacillus miurensis]|uniref:HD domain-containing protein n=1 Tax=Halolactibacillus miurensis TaxID=306541 RepID=A0A1I6SKC1_9BACI|nr:HD domain-containing protein [Halolactibacillus miurensis]GEM04046.1 phosphohydrolase [Halolactibacillus miurensis]SFS77218.1 HD domain-containing protein [Halolactibacillus miurensis]